MGFVSGGNEPRCRQEEFGRFFNFSPGLQIPKLSADVCFSREHNGPVPTSSSQTKQQFN
jgi:hypothetical protein